MMTTETDKGLVKAIAPPQPWLVVGILYGVLVLMVLWFLHEAAYSGFRQSESETPAIESTTSAQRSALIEVRDETHPTSGSSGTVRARPGNTSVEVASVELPHRRRPERLTGSVGRQRSCGPVRQTIHRR